MIDEHPVHCTDILTGCQLLEADAGTGKTWTICRLVLRALLERRLEIGQIAVLTYTRAAAAELRQRIVDLIDRCLAGALEDDPFLGLYRPPVDDQHMHELLRLARLSMDEAMIGTIHSFCQRVLGDHALSLGRWDDVEPEGDLGDALDHALAAWWRGTLADPDPGLARLLGGRGLRRHGLRGVLERLLADPRAQVWPPPADGDWRALAGELDEALAATADALVRERGALTTWQASGKTVNRKVWNAARVPAWLADLQAWLEAADPDLDNPPTALRQLTLRKALRGDAPPDAVQEETGGLRFFAALARLNRAMARRMSLETEVAVQILPAIRQQLEARERRAGQMRFDSMVTTVADALADPTHGVRLAARLRERFPLTFVDEFQDTDPVQWRIFEHIYLRGPATGSDAAWGLVLVGDPKQAIYGFRNADIHTYLAAAARADRRHRLDQNRRASPALVAALNRLIVGDAPFLLPGIDYRGARPAAAAAEPDGWQTDGRGTCTLVALADDDAQTPPKRADLIRRACDAVAAEIVRLLAHDAPPRPRDIAVLVRTAREGAEVKRALGRRRVGAVEISRASVFASPMALELHRLLVGLANRGDPQGLRAAGYTRLMAVDGEDDADDGAVLAALVADLSRCAADWADHGPAHALYALLWTRRGRSGPLCAQPEGERGLTDLLHLIELVASATQAAHGPAQAARWLGERIDEATRPERRRIVAEHAYLRLESDDDLVRIQTVHTSKGLEYPIVFVPFLWIDPGDEGRDGNVFALSDRSGGAPVRRLVQALSGERKRCLEALEDLAESGAADPSWTVGAVGRMIEHDAFAERLRLAYVALTRASRRLYLFHQPSLDGKGGAAGSRSDAGAGDGAGDGGGARGRRSGTTTTARSALAHWLCRLAAGPDGDLPRPVAADFASALASLDDCPEIRQVNWRDLYAPAEGMAASGSDAGTEAVPAGAGAAPALVLLSPGRVIGRAWTRRSFTALMLGSRAESDRPAGPDHDEATVEADGAADPAADADPDSGAGADSGSDAGAGPAAAGGSRGQAAAGGRDGAAQTGSDASWVPSIRDTFARGAHAGVCLHDLLEQHDPRVRMDVGRVGRHLQRFGFEAGQAAAVAAWLDEALDADLGVAGVPLRLRGLSPTDMVRELPFLLSADDVDPARLADLVARELPLDPLAGQSRWRGYLNGFIDVLARQDGRYWIIDWKSNWLGSGPTAYDGKAMTEAVHAHGYSLQIALYSLAVHRWLRLRLAGYDYERDFGGVAYLFLRGVGDARAVAGAGIHRARPSPDLIDRLDRLFGPGLAEISGGLTEAGPDE